MVSDDVVRLSDLAEYLQEDMNRVIEYGGISMTSQAQIDAICNVLAELERLQGVERRIRAVLEYAHDGGCVYSIQEILDGNPEPQRDEAGNADKAREAEEAQ